VLYAAFVQAVWLIGGYATNPSG